MFLAACPCNTSAGSYRFCSHLPDLPRLRPWAVAHALHSRA
ncbi:hypothetical protein [Diaphorobacter sp.]